MGELKKGDKIKIGKLETIVDYVTNLDSQIMVGTEYGEINIDLVEKIEDEGLRYAEDYLSHDLNNYVGIVPIRELEANEEIDSICQIRDDRTGITHIGFVVKVWDTATIFNTIWIGSKLAQEETWLEAINKEIEYLTGGEEMKSMNESMCDSGIVKTLEKIKKKFK
jgi:hypothetical protein